MSFDPVSYAMGRAAAPGGTDVSDTTATAADVLSAKAFYLANGTKTQGSIASKPAQTYTPTTADQTIAAGQYLSGAQTVKGDANLVAGNIKKDVTIFGVTGSHEGGGGGNQPTLFAPIVTGGVNTVSWANNTNNGGFSVTITADLDGTPVTSPLTITQQMDGGVLTVTASAANFVSAVTQITLVYVSPSQSVLAITYTQAGVDADTYIYPTVGSSSLSGLAMVIKGSECNAGTDLTAPESGRNKSLTWNPEIYWIANKTGSVSMRLLIHRWGKTPDIVTTDIKYIQTDGSVLFTGSISVIRVSTQETIFTKTLTRENMGTPSPSTLSFSAVDGEHYTIAVNGTFTVVS